MRYAHLQQEKRRERAEERRTEGGMEAAARHPLHDSHVDL